MKVTSLMLATFLASKSLFAEATDSEKIFDDEPCLCSGDEPEGEKMKERETDVKIIDTVRCYNKNEREKIARAIVALKKCRSELALKTDYIDTLHSDPSVTIKEKPTQGLYFLMGFIAGSLAATLALNLSQKSWH